LESGAKHPYPYTDYFLFFESGAKHPYPYPDYFFLSDTDNARLRAINEIVQIWLLDNVTMTTI
jgi:hypothetical protein